MYKSLCLGAHFGVKVRSDKVKFRWAHRARMALSRDANGFGFLNKWAKKGKELANALSTKRMRASRGGSRAWCEERVGEKSNSVLPGMRMSMQQSAEIGWAQKDRKERERSEAKKGEAKQFGGL